MRTKSNRGFLKVREWLAASAALLLTLGFLQNATAACERCYTGFCSCETPEINIYADYIYWQVNVEGTEFARLGGDSGEISSSTNTGKIYSLPCDFESGFRIGGRTNLDCCEWDAYVQYIFLAERLTNSVYPETGETPLSLFPLVYSNVGLDPVDFAKGDWLSNFNTADFGLGRTFEVEWCHSCAKFRPHFGVKATWQNYKFNITYERIVSTTLTNRDRILLYSELEGLGLRGGFDASWNFTPCISLVGSVAVSTIYSYWRTKRNDWRHLVTNGEEGEGTNNVWLRYCTCLLIPVLELQAGLQFTKEFCDGYKGLLMVGFENQVWFGANRFIYFGNSTSNNNYVFNTGNLTFQGLVLRGGVTY